MYRIIRCQYDDSLFNEEVYELLEYKGDSNSNYKNESKMISRLDKISFCTFRGSYNQRIIHLLEDNKFKFIDDFMIARIHKKKFTKLVKKIGISIDVVRGPLNPETIENIIIQTQIGQLTLDKADVSNVKEIASIDANVEFTDEPDEKINANYHVYSGTVQNKGLETASFVRVIFKLWSSETELIAIDSSFIDGSQIIYRSGINTDTALKPGESGEYVVNVKTPIDSNVQYITRDIHWEIYK